MPTLVLSGEPSSVPSQYSNTPSVYSSTEPSLTLYIQPSSTPTFLPSFTRLILPTQVPSITNVPSSMLTKSQIPSLPPSVALSSIPSSVPSIIQSSIPSSIPSVWQFPYDVDNKSSANKEKWKPKIKVNIENYLSNDNIKLKGHKIQGTFTNTKGIEQNMETCNTDNTGSCLLSGPSITKKKNNKGIDTSIFTLKNIVIKNNGVEEDFPINEEHILSWKKS